MQEGGGTRRDVAEGLPELVVDGRELLAVPAPAIKICNNNNNINNIKNNSRNVLAPLAFAPRGVELDEQAKAHDGQTPLQLILQIYFLYNFYQVLACVPRCADLD